eukprot:13576742-Alexandrium_andersonii.AAC.1
MQTCKSSANIDTDSPRSGRSKSWAALSRSGPSGSWPKSGPLRPDRASSRSGRTSRGKSSTG